MEGMHSVASFAIGVLSAGRWSLFLLGGLVQDEGDALVVRVLPFLSLVASVAGVVLGVFGLVLQEARRVASAGIVLNLVPWGIVGFGVLFGGC